MIVRSVINPLKEKIFFCIDLSIQFSETKTDAMSPKIFLKVSKHVWAPLERIFSRPNVYDTETVLTWKSTISSKLYFVPSI